MSTSDCKEINVDIVLVRPGPMYYSHLTVMRFTSKIALKSNLGTVRVATLRGRPTDSCHAQSFNRICQVAPVCMAI